mmetsp:Transcript_46948/g.98503  ORF Transcript_46948/g.98503 Transcript_46948/m.98503 type:complete len:89 (-) Transcript_46948:557-823(-)
MPDGRGVRKPTVNGEELGEADGFNASKDSNCPCVGKGVNDSDGLIVGLRDGVFEADGKLDGRIDGEEDFSFFRILCSLMSNGSPLKPS